jgi:putative DNA primase/helicase
MSPLPNVVDFAAKAAQEDAVVELEQRLLGWQLKGASGVLEAVVAELRNDSRSFQAPYDRVQAAIVRETEAGRTVSVSTINAILHDCPGLAQIGGADHLRAMADAAPAVVSEEAGRRQAMEAIRSWRQFQSRLASPGDVELIRADAIRPTKIDWIWPGWLAAGKFHLIAGSPGTGKTTLSLSMAATITTGGAFPCGHQADVGSVLMWTGEDDLADSIVPRFQACAGDRARLHFVSGVRADNGEIIPFDPACDIERLIVAARAINDLRLLIVDPVVSAVSGDSHKNGETRRALQPLVDFAAQAGIAVLGVTHYSKGTSGRDPAERVTGSLAFVAVSRLVMVTGKPKEPGERWRLVRAKSNIGPDGGGFEYDLQRNQVDREQDIFGQYVLWGEALEGSAQALLAEVETADTNADAPNRQAAEEWLAELLGAGMVKAGHIRARAEQAGHKWATVRRAKTVLGVEAIKLGLGGWAWQMPKMLAPSEDAHLNNDEHLRAFEDAHLNSFE